MRRGGIPTAYAVAVLAVLTALGVRWALQPILGQGSPFLAFILAVLLSSWLGGWKPGLLATGLSILAADYFFLPPIHAFGLATTSQAVQLGLFLGVSLAICGLNDRLSASLERLRSGAEALRQSDERFRLLVEGVGDYAIFMLDPEGKIVLWNLGAERIKGYKAEEIVGRHFSVFYPPEEVERQAPEHHLQDAARAGTYQEEGWRVKKDGSRFWAHVTLTALRDPAGRLRGFAKVTRDATERRQAEEEIRRFTESLEQRVQERTAQLAEANKALEAFAYTVSHDLRAPLRGIQGFAEALLEDYADRLDPTGQDYARRIAAAAARMEGLIQDLLAYSRLSRAQVVPQRVDLSTAVAEALSQVEALAAPGFRLAVEEPLPVVYAHRPTLVQVLANLLSNAAKFVPPGTEPAVRVRGESRDGRVRLWVEDNGIGIAPEHQERIFNVFERLHGGETYPGTGIGLAIVRKGMERMGGRTGVDSEPGRGARFWIELPGARDDA